MRTFWGVLLGLVTLAGGATPAWAITGGQPDEKRHPNVGLILAYQEGGGRSRCTATLISATVLLTAGHCTDGTLGSTLVTFDSSIAEQPPAPFPAASDPAAGFTPEEIAAGGYLSGTVVAHPDYLPAGDSSNWIDVGVVVLDEPVTDLSMAELAPPAYLDRYRQPRLSSTIFTLVGYGTEVRKPESGPQKPQPMDFPLVRRYTTAPGQKLTPRVLQVNGNPGDTRGGGGTCFGDSGGPVFIDDYLVAVSSYGLTANCRYLSGYQRVDLPVVQEWLAGL